MKTIVTEEQILSEFEVLTILEATVSEAISELSRCSNFNENEIRQILEKQFGNLETYQVQRLLRKNAKN